MTTIIFGVLLMWVGITALAVYLLAEYNIFFTKVPEGEIIVIMVSDNVLKYISNIEGFWVEPKTGKVHPNSVSRPKLPINLKGIYWMGIWPFVSRYTYKFPRNKYVKKEGGIGYELVPKDDEADSIYFRASYPVRMSGLETKEGVPITFDVLFTTETVDADQALFKIKSPGWLSALTAAVQAGYRDFVGNKTLIEITRLKAETSESGSARSEFQGVVDALNNSTVGNPSLEESFGQKIIAVNFLGYTIDEVTNPLQQASIAKYEAERLAEKTVTASRAEADAAKNEAEKIETLAKANAKKTQVEGEAAATAAKLMTNAVKDNPHAGTIALAGAIKDQTHATTLILGAGIMPTKEVS